MAGGVVAGELLSALNRELCREIHSRQFIHSAEFPPNPQSSRELAAQFKRDISFANRELQGTRMGNPEYSINSIVPQRFREGTSTIDGFQLERGVPPPPS